MIGCGKPWNAGHQVEGAPLRCGNSLYWKTGKGKDNTRTQETILCDECKNTKEK